MTSSSLSPVLATDLLLTSLKPLVIQASHSFSFSPRSQIRFIIFLSR